MDVNNKKINSGRRSAEDRDIKALLDDLTCDDVAKCQQARKSLVAMGKPAIPALIGALHHENRQVRWEAAKALGQVADPLATDEFIKTLYCEEDFDIRWLAADGLISIGKPALKSLLMALIEHSHSPWLLSGAHRILHGLAHKGYYDLLKPVLVALENLEPRLEVPIAAKKVLDKLAAA